MMKQSPLRSPSRLQPPSHGHHSHQRSHNLHLPGLPRFHPAQYQQSAESSTVTSPASGLNSPQAPLSPRQQHRMYSEAQRQLYYFQREMMTTRMHLDDGTRSAHRSPKPVSPRLHPLGSPGPVTPLELEEEQQERHSVGQSGSYFLIGQPSPHKKTLSKDMKDQLWESLGPTDYSAVASPSISARRASPGSSVGLSR